MTTGWPSCGLISCGDRSRPGVVAAAGRERSAAISRVMRGNSRIIAGGTMANTVQSVDKVFAGSIPQLYEQYLVPLIFEPYAADLAARLSRRAPARVLEIAAGTGVVTRALARALP